MRDSAYAASFLLHSENSIYEAMSKVKEFVMSKHLPAGSDFMRIIAPITVLPLMLSSTYGMESKNVWSKSTGWFAKYTN